MESYKPYKTTNYPSEEEEEEEEGEIMDKQVYKAAVEGKTSIITDAAANQNDLLRKTPHNNNIIHIAVRHERLEFIQEVVKRFPELISEANSDGDNPLHLAAQTGNLDILEMLVDSYKEEEEEETKLKPWRMKNKEGNTPLHVALIYGKIKVAYFLVERDGAKLARIRNNSKETPLHLAIQYHVDNDLKVLKAAGKVVAKKLDNRFTKSKCWVEKDSMCVIELLLQKARSVACWCDTQGLTPLLRAAMLDPPYVPAINAVLQHCPESTEVCDGSGRTLLHLINNLPSCLDYKDLLNASPEVEVLKNIRDKEGNTPTHLALQNQNIDLFLVLLLYGVNLVVRKKDGVSAADLIQQQSDGFWEHRIAEEQKEYEKLVEDEVGSKLSKDEEEAIENMDITFLRQRIREVGSSFFLRLDPDILRQIDWNKYQSFDKDQKEFIQQVLEASPLLMYHIDTFGEIPLHEIVMWAPEVVDRPFLEKLRQDYRQIEAEASTIEQLCYDPPWKAKDIIGNTPLHQALKFYTEARYIKCTKEMLEFDPELAVEVNDYGETPLHLLFISFSRNDNNLVQEGMMADVKAIVSKSVVAAKMKDAEGNGIWHYLADMKITDERRGIILKFLFDGFDSVFYIDLSVGNNDNNTPLHLAVKNDNFELAHIFNRLLSEKTILYQKLDYLLKKRNKDGNTPFHLVVGRSEQPLAEGFIQHALDKTFRLGDVLSVYDDEGNTPLHLAILKKDFKLVKMFIQSAVTKGVHDQLLNMPNKKEGKTPLHLVVGRSEHIFAEEFIQHVVDNICQLGDVLGVCDNEGNTPLHEAMLKKDLNLIEMFIHCAMKKGQQDEVLKVANNKGNTLLHEAIMNKDFNRAKMFIQSVIEIGKQDQVLNIPNYKGETPNDLIGSAQHLTPEFEEYIWSGHEIVDSMVGVRSLIGVSTEMIKEYTNTLGVIAALLATITFTIAFTTPGGLDNNNGTPLLMRKMAFQVFMISDILAMCFSMIVLFCLLWIMTISTKKDQVMLLDFTVVLLEAAFYATLLTFMMGLYVTVSPITHWIAILTCALCSLLIILMHKRIITRLIPYLIQIYARFRKVYTSYRKSCGPIENGCRIKHQNNEEGSTNLSQANEQEEVNVEMSQLMRNETVSNP